MKDFDQSLPMVLYRTLDNIMPRFRHIFAQFDLTEQQWRVLRVLWEEDQQPLQGLADATLISAPSLVGVVDRLSARGIVKRVKSVDDRRVTNICLTDTGRNLESKVSPLVNAAYAELENTLNPSQWRTLHSLLNKIGNPGM